MVNLMGHVWLKCPIFICCVAATGSTESTLNSLITLIKYIGCSDVTWYRVIFFFLFLSFFPECVILLSQQIKWLSVRQTKPKYAQHSSWIMKKTRAGFSFSVHLEGPDTASLTCKRSTGGFHGYRCIYNSVGTLLILPKRKSAWPQQAQKSIVVLQRTWAPARTRRGKKEPLNRFSAEGDVVSAKVFLEESD